MNGKNIGIAIVALAVVGFATYQFIGSSTVSDTTNQQRVQKQDDVSDKGNIVQSEDLADGQYQATGSYKSPAGDEELGVTITIQDNIVTDASVDVVAENQVSIKMQTLFQEGFQEEVIGKNITEVELDKVNGSSLTSVGFNDAVDQIIEQAQS